MDLQSQKDFRKSVEFVCEGEYTFVTFEKTFKNDLFLYSYKHKMATF